MTFACAFNVAYTIKYDLQVMCDKPIPYKMYTDIISLFDVLPKAEMKIEKRFMVYIQSVKNFYTTFIISLTSNLNTTLAMRYSKSKMIQY